MGSPSVPTTHKVLARSRVLQTLLWLAVLVIAVFGGAAATRISTAYIVGFLALAVVLVLFLWRSQDPMVPFLLLVAALQGGVLLQISVGDAPVSTLMPFLGGWTLLAVLVYRGKGRSTRSSFASTGVLARSLVTLAVVVVLTAIAQYWRSDGRLLSFTEIFTIVQLAILVLLAAYLLTSPRNVMLMAYVAIASGVVVAVTALADQAGLVSLGTEMSYGGQYTRVSGLLEDPNFFSFQLLIALAFAIHVAAAARSTTARVLAWLAFGILVAGIVTSFSAGALVGLGALVGTTLVLQFKVSTKRAAAVLVAMAVVAAIVAFTAPPEYGQAVKEKFSSITNSSFEELGTKRGAAWEASAQEILHNPVLGTGFSSENEVLAIADYYKLYSTDRKAAHNMYLGMGVTTGVVGLVAFLCALGAALWSLWNIHSRAAEAGDSDTVLAVACVFTAMAVVAIQGIQLDTQFMKYTWLLFGACLGIQKWKLTYAKAQSTAE